MVQLTVYRVYSCKMLQHFDAFCASTSVHPRHHWFSFSFHFDQNRPIRLLPPRVRPHASLRFADPRSPATRDTSTHNHVEVMPRKRHFRELWQHEKDWKGTTSIFSLLQSRWTTLFPLFVDTTCWFLTSNGVKEIELNGGTLHFWMIFFTSSRIPRILIEFFPSTMVLVIWLLNLRTWNILNSQVTSRKLDIESFRACTPRTTGTLESSVTTLQRKFWQWNFNSECFTLKHQQSRNFSPCLSSIHDFLIFCANQPPYTAESRN